MKYKSICFNKLLHHFQSAQKHRSHLERSWEIFLMKPAQKLTLWENSVYQTNTSIEKKMKHENKL